VTTMSASAREAKAAWRSLPADDAPLEPLKIPPEAEPREGIVRRCSKTP